MTRLNREEFIRILEAVSPGLSAREFLEQSTCLVFQEGQVQTFNDHVACRCPTGLDKDFTGAVVAKSLLDMLKKLEDDTIKIEREDSRMIVTGKGKRSRFHMQQEIFLPIHAVEEPNEWTKLHPEFSDAIQMVHECAGRDEHNRPDLVNVHIAPKWVEATDKFQICRYTLDTNFSESVLVKAEHIKSMTTLGMTDFSVTSSWCHFKNPLGLIFSIRRSLEDYHIPDEYLVMDGEQTVIPKGLAQAAERAGIFSAENADGDIVTVEFHHDKLRIKGIGITGDHVEFKMLKYKGRPLAFLIKPALLVSITKKYNDARVSETALKVDGGAWKYVTSLGTPSKDEPERNGRKKKSKKHEEEE